MKMNKVLETFEVKVPFVGSKEYEEIVSKMSEEEKTANMVFAYHTPEQFSRSKICKRFFEDMLFNFTAERNALDRNPEYLETCFCLYNDFKKKRIYCLGFLVFSEKDERISMRTVLMAWLHPYIRNLGIMSLMVDYAIDRFGFINLEVPISKPMHACVDKVIKARGPEYFNEMIKNQRKAFEVVYELDLSHLDEAEFKKIFLFINQSIDVMSKQQKINWEEVKNLYKILMSKEKKEFSINLIDYIKSLTIEQRQDMINSGFFEDWKIKK